MSYSLNSLKGGYIGDHIGGYERGYEGDTRSLDYGSYGGCPKIGGPILYSQVLGGIL